MTVKLADLANGFAASLERARLSDGYRPALVPTGTVVSVTNGVAQVRGLRDVFADELIRLPKGLAGLATSIREDGVGLILLGDAASLRTGDDARRTGHIISVPVGEGLLGRVVDPLGKPLDSGGPVKFRSLRPCDAPAPAIMDRAPVTVPLQTGIKSIDAAIPIGRGQRELILGDRQTGKTTIALSAILNQHDSGVLSVYCAIGQRTSAVARVIARLKETGALERTVVVVASGEDAPGLQYIAPYTATTMAEHFMRAGQDVVVVYDDLTRHARAYRELSLLLRRPPGREAYPGDIFYIHARLLERATHLRQEHGGGSLTALPIIETQAQNISDYIPTNLISITDGQIYVSSDLFRKGQLPAIDIGMSVSRVGGEAQLSAYRAVAGDLKIAYSQFEDLEAFSRFGTRLDDDTRQQLERGRRVRQVLRQEEADLLPVGEQIAVLLATTSGLLDDIPVDRMVDAEGAVRQAFRDRLGDVAARIDAGHTLTSANRDAVIAASDAALSSAGLKQSS